MDNKDIVIERADNSEDNSDDRLFSFKYIVTILGCLTCIILYIGINSENQIDSWEIYKKWGAPWIIDIFNGSYWGLITSAFLHIEIWHIIFNLYWFWILGRKIESETNSLVFLGIVISTALVSSLTQMSFTDSTGIGLSGVAYGLFGFIYIKSKSCLGYKAFLSTKIIMLFFGWLILCIILTHLKKWDIGNAAHIGGLLFGITLGYASRFKWITQLLIVLFLISFSAFIALNSSLSISYLNYSAYKLHEEQQVDKAYEIYSKVLSRDPDNEFATINLKQLEVHKLSNVAFDLHNSGKYNDARNVYNEILKIDTGNTWAKDNIDLLPDTNQYK